MEAASPALPPSRLEAYKQRAAAAAAGPEIEAAAAAAASKAEAGAAHRLTARGASARGLAESPAQSPVEQAAEGAAAGVAGLGLARLEYGLEVRPRARLALRQHTRTPDPCPACCAAFL